MGRAAVPTLHPVKFPLPTARSLPGAFAEKRKTSRNPQPKRGAALLFKTVTSRRYKDFRPAPLASALFHRQNCDMPDSDPSSTSSAPSNRDLPAEEAGDHCRRCDDLRLASGLSRLPQRGPLPIVNDGWPQPAGFTDGPDFHFRGAALWNLN